MAANDLTTLAALKAWDSSISGSTADAVLGTLITATSADFLREIKRPDLLTATYTEQRVGDGSVRLMLRHWPVTAISNVTIAGTSIPSGDIFFDPTLDPEKTFIVYLTAGYAFTDGAAVSVAYTAGYAAVPTDIAQAVLEWCTLRWKKKAVTGATQVRNIEGERADVDPSAIPPNTQRIIDLYKREWPSYTRVPEAAVAAQPFGRGMQGRGR